MHLCGGHRLAVLSILYFVHNSVVSTGSVVVDDSVVGGCCLVMKNLKGPQKCVFGQLFQVSQILILSTEFV